MQNLICSLWIGCLSRDKKLPKVIKSVCFLLKQGRKIKRFIALKSQWHLPTPPHPVQRFHKHKSVHKSGQIELNLTFIQLYKLLVQDAK